MRPIAARYLRAIRTAELVFAGILIALAAVDLGRGDWLDVWNLLATAGLILAMRQLGIRLGASSVDVRPRSRSQR